ncbi:MAG: fasciclin domain-containing protein [Chitinophagaceae bacterium]
MKKYKVVFFLLLAGAVTACNTATEQATATDNAASSAIPAGGQENVKDDVSAKDVVKVAVGSKDHTTLVAALKQADLVTSLSNAGPFTVFAPTNAAFNKLPEGTVEGLMKNDQKEALQNILQYHVALSALKAESFTDGQVLGMVNGDNVTVTIKDGKVMLNNSATIIASVPASNGIVHIIDGVLLPPAKK